jgi:hypothetical protein
LTVNEFFEMLKAWFSYASWSTAQQLQVSDVAVFIMRLINAVSPSSSLGLPSYRNNSWNFSDHNNFLSILYLDMALIGENVTHAFDSDALSIILLVVVTV